MDTEVLIIGGGPTGLTLAIDLGLRGVRAQATALQLPNGLNWREVTEFSPALGAQLESSLPIDRDLNYIDNMQASLERPVDPG
jgi:FAD binding domain